MTARGADLPQPFQFNPLPWADRAACKGMNPNLFRPGRGGDTITPKAICARCPVQQDCLEFSVSTNQRVGIWGGLGERARRSIVLGRPLRLVVAAPLVAGCLVAGWLKRRAWLTQEAIEAATFPVNELHPQHPKGNP